MTRLMQLGILISILVVTISGAVIRVPQDFSTIQGGIDAAASGDSVIIQPGTYNENINFNGKNIVVGSMYLTTRDTSYISSTIIDGQANGIVVAIMNSGGGLASLVGLTVQNGMSGGYSGGCHISNSIAQIQNCNISGNTAQFGGGVSIIAGSTVQIIGTVVNDNIAFTGGGLVVDASIVLIQGSEIQNNTVVGDNCSGGGITIRNSSELEVVNSMISNNFADGVGADGGGIMLAQASSISVSHTLINANIIGGAATGTTEESGGAIRVDGGCTFNLSNCTIVNNVAAYGGGGVWNQSSNYSEIVNTIFFGNSPNTFQGIYLESIAVNYSSINDLPAYYNNGTSISDNPQFSDEGVGDFTLQIISPCIDMGNPDLDDDSETWETDPDDQDPDGTRVDMGAYYFHHSLKTPPDTLWTALAGGVNPERAYEVQQTTDGGYILAGYTESFGSGGQDYWLVKTDYLGNEEWNRTFGGAQEDRASSVQQTKDGGYIIAGYTRSFGDIAGDFWLVKTDYLGNEEWTQSYGGGEGEWAHSVREISDGGYIVAGYTESFGQGGQDCWVIRTDEFGNTVWSQTIGGSLDEQIYDVQPTLDGGFILAGATEMYSNDHWDGWLIKIDSQGNIVWDYPFGGTSQDWFNSVFQTSDGGYIVAGYTYSSGSGGADGYLVKTDNLGVEQWSRTYGKTADDHFYDVKQTIDGGFILSGATESEDGSSYWDYWVIKTDNGGLVEWEQIFGGANGDWGQAIDQTRDEGYVTAGFTNSFGNGQDEFWLIRMGGDQPAVHISSPDYNFSIPENDTLSIEWNSSNCVDADIFFSLNPQSNFVQVGHTSASSGSYSFRPPGGYSDSARVKLVVSDSEGSQAEGSSPYFQIRYSGPVWHISIEGSDELGDGSYISPFASIQFGIDASQNSDSVLVQPGTYLENISYNGKNIVLASLFLTTQDTSYISSTIIDGQAAGSVLTINDSQDSSARLSGFTIQNGRSLEPDSFNNGYGGGLYIGVNASPQIDNLIIRDCYSQNSGGGIACFGSPTLVGLLIHDNSTGQAGGGVDIGQFSNSTMESCQILRNGAGTVGGGIIIFAYGNSVDLYQCLIADNTSARHGAGIYIAGGDASERRIINCTIAGNVVSGEYQGGGIYQGSGQTILVENTIIWGNAPNSIEQGHISYPLEINFSQIEGAWDGIANSDIDPLFDSGSNNPYSLANISPCIDTGNPDLDGDDTSWETDEDDQDPDGTRLDMGAYYYHQEPVYEGPIWHISPAGSDETGDGSYEFPFASIQFGIDASQNSDTVLVQPGEYFENINYNGKDIVLASFFLTTQNRAYILSTIIDGTGGAAVTGVANLEGFTITNGSPGISGGGGNVINCNIEYNNQGFDGSGSLNIIRSLIRYNSGSDGAAIRWLDVGVGTLNIVNSAIVSNEGSWYVALHKINNNQTVINITNCTIADNHASQQEVIRGTNINITNSIIYSNDLDNYPQLLMQGEYNVTYSDLQVPWTGVGNLNSDPEFVGMEGGDFNLMSSSPCIDTGNPYLPSDPDGTIADMGAYFFDQTNYYPQISISPDSLGFTLNTDDGFEQSQTLTIFNSGSAPLEVAISTDSTIVTDIDGNIYPTVQIGDQTWMAENLKVTQYRDGTAIPNLTIDGNWASASSGAFCVYNNNASNEGDTHGALYNWFAATDSGNIAPEGWHVPTDDEWTELETYLSNNGHSGTEGATLKSTTGWNFDGNGTDDYGFTALPGGYRYYNNGAYGNIGESGSFWSATEANISSAWHRRLYYDNLEITQNYGGKRNGFAIRCLRDSWLSTTPTVLTIQPDESVEVMVSVNAEGLELGEYSDVITLLCNDALNGVIEVPITMNVTNGTTEYSGPIWHVATEGSDEIGDGSQEAPFATIQFGIDASQNSDTILVQPGTYLENINYNGKNIVIGSLTLTTGDTSFIRQTIIDGNQEGSVVMWSSGEDSTSVLDGFTIQNGNSSGGIICQSADPILKNLLITNNHSDNPGGGILFQQSNSKLYNVSIIGNEAVGGGGVYLSSSSDIYFEGVEITDNTSSFVGGGIGIDNCELQLEDCRISGNYAPSQGGGIWAVDGQLKINRSVIEGNTSANDGGGVACRDGTILIIDSTDVRENSAGIEGGGFYLHNNDSVRIVFTSISDNQATNNGGAIVLRGYNNDPYFQNLTVTNNTASNTAEILDYANSSTYLNCIIWHSDGGGVDIDHQYEAEYSFMPEYVGGGTNTGDVGTINNSDPQFAFPDTGNYALLITSGCIDTGDPDLDDDGTPWETDPDDQDPDGTRMDMGAYYFDQSNLFPQISISPDSLGFTIITENSLEQSQTLTISNTGDGPLDVEIYTNSGMVTDIDGNIYPIVQIDNQVWMAENLKVTHNRDGTTISHVPDPEVWITTISGAFCIYNNNSSNEAETYGALYNWNAVADNRNIAPQGWHIPTDDEWKELEMALGMSQLQADATGHRGTNEGSELAGNADLWNDGALENSEAFGSSGFIAVPGGVRNGSTYTGIGNWAYFWSSSQYDEDNAWTRGLHSYDTYIDRDVDPKINGYSIRCLMDGVSSLTDWLSTTPVSLTIPPGESSDVTVSVNAEGMELGDYSDMIIITSNDATNNLIDIPVTMNVIPAYSGPVWHVSTQGSDETGDGSNESPFATIQFGIDGSQIGDTVLVQPGTYIENINYEGKNIVVGSFFLTTLDTSYISQTVINGGANDHVVSFENDETQNAQLSGFTIQNGFAVYGGGIYCMAASPTLDHLIIKDNSVAGSQSRGGGVYCANATLTISNTSIFNNNGGWWGGGVFCEDNSVISLQNVALWGNQADGGGAVVCGNYAFLSLENVTIVGNIANDNGGAIECMYQAQVDIISSILWNNLPQEIEINPSVISVIVNIDHSDISGGFDGIITNDNGIVNWLEGNIDADPLFVDTDNGDYQLQDLSPCIDAGNPESPFDPDGTRADMGAYSFDQTDYFPQISISPDSLEFTVNTAESFEQSQTLTITNSGLAPLDVAIYPSEIVTDIDGNSYPTVLIGDQVWMAENLKVTHYQDGTAIPNLTADGDWTSTSSGAYCIYNNNASNEADTYGALYNWYAVADSRNIAPEGWHLPTFVEWNELETYLSNNGHTGSEGTALKSVTGWNSGGNGTDDYGFTALPGGCRPYDNGEYIYLGDYAYFWSANESNSSTAVSRHLNSTHSGIQSNTFNKSFGFAIRCVRDLNSGLSDNSTSQKKGSTPQKDIILSGAVSNEESPIDINLSRLTIIPDTLSIQPGESAEVMVTANAQGLDLGEYSDLITIISNDPTNSLIEVPITMSVIFQDLISPEVQLNIPDITEMVRNGDTLTVTWTASDNVALDWAKLFFTFTGGASFSLYDSVDANLGQIEWIAPDVISNTCNFAIWVSDLAGNVSADTLSGSFAIIDATPPLISILSPTQTTSVRENDSLVVSWEVQDNVGIDYVEIWYSRNPPSEPYIGIANITDGSTSYSVRIRTGVTDNARFKMLAQDHSGNDGFDESESFSVTDGTRPVISDLSIPDTASFGIGSGMEIMVNATDNVEVTGLDLNYSPDAGNTWIPIVQGLYPVQEHTSYGWLIPNIPGTCQIQAIVTDAVGLTDSAYSSIFSIIVEYPLLIASLPKIAPWGDLHLSFSQVMDSLDISLGTQVTGSVGGAYEIDGAFSGPEVIISAREGFVSLDTLMIVLSASEWTNTFGYGLDGNRDGVYGGNSIDNDTAYTIVSAAGDYNQDDAFNFDDFNEFVIAWHANEYRYELAPNTHEIPHISIQPDSLFNIFDLATFASMWNWSAGISLSAPLTDQFQYEDFVSEQVGNALTVALPRDEYLASQVIIKYDPGLVSISVADQGLAKVSSNGLSLVDANPDSGFILITSSQMSESSENPLQLTLAPITRQRYSIEVAIQGSDMDANVVQKRSLIDLLPIPTSFSLSQNYPNPFNASTTIEYGLPKDSDLSISIYDIRGRFVKDIYTGEKQAGYHVTQWNGANDAGQNVASGLYFIVLHTPEYRMARKALILK